MVYRFHMNTFFPIECMYGRFHGRSTYRQTILAQNVPRMSVRKMILFFLFVCLFCVFFFTPGFAMLMSPNKDENA